MGVTEKVITICMGSSCFSRGNGQNHALIVKFLDQNRLNAKVLVKGCRCGGQCMNGPNIWIGETLFSNIDQGSLIDILKHEFE